MYSSIGAYYVPTAATPISPTDTFNQHPNPAAGLGADDGKATAWLAYAAGGALIYYFFFRPKRRA